MTDDFIAALALEIDITRRLNFVAGCALLHDHADETGKPIPCGGRIDRLCHEIVSDPEIGTGRWATAT
jgi:hypothetical protein